ncbi:MAG: TonB-dependent receptor [Acidobacteria bacterium]|nr:TonB-dependent receptor [Acidobacteriota bacterium]
MTASTAFFLSQLLLALPGGSPIQQAPATTTASTATTVSGVVRDAGGGVIAGANVIVRVASGAERQGVAGSDGRFSVTAPAPGAVTVIVRADGFAEFRRTFAAGEPAGAVEATLAAAGITEQVSVTPTRTEQRLGDVPAAVNVIAKEEIRQTPAVVADDVLRRLPEFSLFRRSSSISAHPTSQGVSLRGIGPSGVSRSLVLLDGVPFNDAFGGWVYWTALPIESAERIEVVNGASSSLYGSYAMGGVLNVVTSQPTRRTVEMKAQYGNRSTPKLDLRASDVWGKVGVAVDATAFDTDGYANVLPSQRGGVDNNVAVQYKNVAVKLDYNPTDRVHAFVRAGYFTEERANGKRTSFTPTIEESNDTAWTYTSGGVRAVLPDSSSLQATVFTDAKEFHSNFLAIPDAGTTRNVGRLSLTQTVPTDAVGGMAQWSRVFRGRHAVTGGMDFRWVDGDSVEDAYDAQTGANKTLHRVAGGTQRLFGLFVQDVITPTDRLTVTLSARVDRWRNYDAHNVETMLSNGAVSDPDLADKQDTVVSPRVGVLYRLTDRVSVWGDLASGFRAPTLNELYRRFSLGAQVTLANPALGPERLVGGEFGINILPVRGLTWRTTVFDNRMKDPVANVTQPSPPNTLKRENLGRTRIWGIQTDADYRIGDHVRVGGAYIYDIAKVRENDVNPALVDRYLQQVPKHRGAFQFQYADPKYFSAGVDVQAVGDQFDDDLNTPARVLPGYAVVNASVSRALGPTLQIFLAAQNLFDKEFWIGTASDASGNPIAPTLIGMPRLVSVGLRIRVQGR